ncbi:hypothetical protein MMB232_00988 [Brevundimonas subvibrioides]|uniref:DUF4214 domain-containing protein n=1 Tax=Brevundimonas subvibrioides TaxID=74313 RepID=UPI0032D572E5
MVDRTTTIAVREHSVFDEKTNILYSLGAERITRWDATTGQFLTPIALAGSLSNLALSPDGRYLVVADRATQAAGSQGVLHRIDLQTLTVTDIRYATAFYEGGVIDLAITANGTVLFTTAFLGSGWTPLRTFSLADAAPTPTVAVSSVRGGSSLTASPDGRYVLILEADTSNGALSLYDSTSGRVIASTDLYRSGLSGFNNDNGSVTDSGLISVVTYNSFIVYNRELVVVSNFSSRQSGGQYSDAEFSLDGRQLYAWNTVTDRVEVYDTTTWRRIGEFDPGVAITSQGNGMPWGRMQVVDDGRLLLMTTPDGVRVIDLNVRLSTTLSGSDAADILTGSVGADTLNGLDGADTLSGGEGNDTLTGGAGADTLIGGVGDDRYDVSEAGDIVTELQGEGTDTVNASLDTYTLGSHVENLNLVGSARAGVGNALNNVVVGNALDNTLSGGDGNDTLTGGAGADTMIGGGGDDRYDVSEAGDIVTELQGEGTDTVNALLDTYTLGSHVENLNLVGPARAGIGNALDNVMVGNALNNTLSGGDGNDILIGGDGFDILNGEGGNDQIQGGAGLDFIEGGLGDDVMDGGTGGERTPQLVGTGTVVNGGDVASYRTATAGVRIDLRISAPQNTVGAGVDTLINFEDISGSDFADILTGDDRANLISGAAGNDQIYGLGGNDVLLSSLGDDFVDGGDGNDYIWAGQLGQQPYVNAGNDTLLGGAGNDRIFGSGGNDRMEGGTGDDTLQGFGGTDILLGGDGNDSIGGDLGDLQIEGGAGDDHISISWTDDGTGSTNGPVNLRRVTGGDGADVIETYDEITAALVLDGGAGNDRLQGARGTDTLLGGAGSDVLDGGAGVDTAVYAGVRRQYATSHTAVSGGPEGGTDTLVSIENTRFLDGTITYDENSTAAEILRIYDATLDRGPDAFGLDGWLQARAGGTTLVQMANSFVNSDEFKARYGALDDDAFVSLLYNFCLNRNVDPLGLKSYTDLLKSGAWSRGDVVLSLSESVEHRQLMAPQLDQGLWIADQTTLTIARLYDATFDRLPDLFGLDAWRQEIAAGRSLNSMAAAFAGSQEFQDRYGALSNADFVRLIYTFCLDRNVDPLGLSSYTDLLNSGQWTRADVLLSLSESSEHRQLTAPLWYDGVRYQGYAGAPVEDAGSTKGDAAFTLVDEAFVVSDPADAVAGPGDHTLAFIRPEAAMADITLFDTGLPGAANAVDGHVDLARIPVDRASLLSFDDAGLWLRPDHHDVWA